VTQADYKGQSPLLSGVAGSDLSAIGFNSARLHQKSQTASVLVKSRILCNAIHFQVSIGPRCELGKIPLTVGASFSLFAPSVFIKVDGTTMVAAVSIFKMPSMRYNMNSRARSEGC
jgi:hypothetical protein